MLLGDWLLFNANSQSALNNNQSPNNMDDQDTNWSERQDNSYEWFLSQTKKLIVKHGSQKVFDLYGVFCINLFLSNIKFSTRYSFITYICNKLELSNKNYINDSFN